MSNSAVFGIRGCSVGSTRVFGRGRFVIGSSGTLEKVAEIFASAKFMNLSSTAFRVIACDPR